MTDLLASILFYLNVKYRYFATFPTLDKQWKGRYLRTELLKAHTFLNQFHLFAKHVDLIDTKDLFRYCFL